MTILIPGLRLPSAGNLREHWAARARRVNAQRSVVCMEWRRQVPHGFTPTFPVAVTVTRVAPRLIDGHDNLPMSCKGIVDQVAAQLGVDDGDAARVRWAYAQRRDRAYAVEIQITTEAGQ